MTQISLACGAAQLVNAATMSSTRFKILISISFIATGKSSFSRSKYVQSISLEIDAWFFPKTTNRTRILHQNKVRGVRLRTGAMRCIGCSHVTIHVRQRILKPELKEINPRCCHWNAIAVNKYRFIVGVQKIETLFRSSYGTYS